MSRSTYRGGSTVISPGGQGWSYDPLAQVPISRTDYGRNASPGSRSQRQETANAMARRRVQEYAIACAACRLLGIGVVPPSRVPYRLRILLDVETAEYHGGFSLYIGSVRSTARELLVEHIDACLSADRSRRCLPELPSPLSFCERHPSFTATLTRKLSRARERGLTGRAALTC